MAISTRGTKMQATLNIQKTVPNKHSGVCSKYPSHQS